MTLRGTDISLRFRLTSLKSQNAGLTAQMKTLGLERFGSGLQAIGWKEEHEPKAHETYPCTTLPPELPWKAQAWPPLCRADPSKPGSHLG